MSIADWSFLAPARRLAWDFTQARALTGLALPPSYRSFSEQVGPGSVGGLFYVCPPLPVPPGGAALAGHHEHWRANLAEMRAHWREEGVEIGEDEALEQDPAFPPVELDRLFFFGGGHNGELLCWDTARPLPSGEFPIHVIGMRYARIRRAADDLQGFFRAMMRADAIQRALGPGYAPIRATFEPW
ncbi:SMI1/KNR4 family protein [Achromobacter insuavis]|uniref:SMI1/KNR4 family protein n=1 Tax=Achromobacter insuavis TaxID=1287735 RepID=UPI001F12A626|nr:SMI1/KNR4 family protein [Achromobacter insuavis]